MDIIKRQRIIIRELDKNVNLKTLTIAWIIEYDVDKVNQK